MKLSDWLINSWFVIFFLASCCTYSQDTIYGQLCSAKGYPLHGVMVINVSSGDYTTTDGDGRYRIPANLSRGDTLDFVSWGHRILDTVPKNELLNVNLERKPLDIEANEEIQQDTSNVKRSFKFNNLYLAFGGLSMDFSAYDDLLDSTALNVLNGAGYWDFGLQGGWGRFNIGFSVGGDWETEIGDSLEYDEITIHYSLSAGYTIFDERDFVIRPNLDLHLVRKRLNVVPAERVSISQYLQNRAIDLRWQQYFVAPSLDILYRLNTTLETFYPTYMKFNSIGLSGGVVFPLHKYPITRTKLQRVENQRPLDLSTYFFEISMTFIVPQRKY